MNKTVLCLLWLFLLIAISFVACERDSEDEANPKLSSKLKNGDSLIYEQIWFGEGFLFWKINQVSADLVDGRKLSFGSLPNSSRVMAQDQDGSLVDIEDISEERPYAITYHADGSDIFKVFALEWEAKEGAEVYLYPKKDGSSTIKYASNNIPAELTQELRIYWVDRFNFQVKKELPEQEFSFTLIMPD